MRALTSLLLILFFATAQAGKPTRTAGVGGVDEPPRVMAALQQGYAAERGIGIRRNTSLAIALYCDAGTMGSPEGFYRIGRILKSRNRSRANGYFALAARLGHREAFTHHDPRVANADIVAGCGSYYAWMEGSHFDLDGFVASLSANKRKIADIVRKMAPKYGVDTGFALGIALAESNLEPRAVSPKNAQGVMQLIPATQERFGIKNAFDPHQNIRGGLTYLRWLDKRYAGNRMMIAAAYNAGEGAVDKYRGVPPFAETQQYVRRVLYFSGASAKKKQREEKTQEIKTSQKMNQTQPEPAKEQPKIQPVSQPVKKQV